MLHHLQNVPTRGVTTNTFERLLVMDGRHIFGFSSTIVHASFCEYLFGLGLPFARYFCVHSVGVDPVDGANVQGVLHRLVNEERILGVVLQHLDIFVPMLFQKCFHVVARPFECHNIEPILVERECAHDEIFGTLCAEQKDNTRVDEGERGTSRRLGRGGVRRRQLFVS